MLYNVVLYTVLLNGGYNILYPLPNSDIYSTVPIVECSVMGYRNEVTNQVISEYICLTERLYYKMTGHNIHVLTVAGQYDV